jgi:hypothetical protein
MRDVSIVVQRFRETNLALAREHGVDPEVIASSLLGLAIRMLSDLGWTREEVHEVVNSAFTAIESEPKE